MTTKKTEELYYLCTGPKGRYLDIGITEKRAGHVFCMFNKKLVLWPKTLSPQYCNPTNIDAIDNRIIIWLQSE